MDPMLNVITVKHLIYLKSNKLIALGAGTVSRYESPRMGEIIAWF